jgi:hypothetical protein
MLVVPGFRPAIIILKLIDLAGSSPCNPTCVWSALARWLGTREHYTNFFSSEVSRMAFFTFPENARLSPERSAVEFGVSIGEYEGVVRVPRRTFQRILDESPTPERCVEAYYLNRTRFERIVEQKLRRLQLTPDANVEITGRDLREPESRRMGAE